MKLSSTSLRPSATERIAFILLSLFLLVLLITLNFPTDPFRLLDTYADHDGPPNTADATGDVDLRILIGVVTISDRYEIRHLHRLVNSLQHPVPNAQVDVRFVFCRLTREEQRVLVALEILRYDDIIILDCPKENMNNGKTYDFFSTVARLYGYNSTADGRRRPYDYVMKTDDDTYHRFPALVESLRPLPRNDLYYGHLVPPDTFIKGDKEFMTGLGYVLSWDIVEWIAASETVKNNTVGFEDKLVAEWLRGGGKGMNMYDTKPSARQVEEWRSGGDRVIDHRGLQYDMPTKWPMRFVPNTISVHRLKDWKKWAKTLRYFNVTVGIRPSKFYDVSQ